MKEKNIGWSPTFQRWVFLDFGFAKVLKAEIGLCVWSKFIGTFNFTINELQSAYYLNESKLIDFYYNDLHGLEIVLSMMKEPSEKKNELKGDIFFSNQSN